MLPLVAAVAFGLYWLSSFLLEARGGTLHFHADTWLYAELGREDVFGGIAPDTQLAQIFRFHPLTVVMAAGWMKFFHFLTPWIAPPHLLKAMFAAVGAVGVWAAMSAFAAVVPRRYVILWGAIYAFSLGVWYFSSIEESKIVTATLSALYIATYLHLRKEWTTRATVLLTAILLVACLNEITAGFLVIIPVVDTLAQRGWDVRNSWWIALHGLAGVFAFTILEGIMRGWPKAAGTHPEGATHFSMLFWYAAQNDTSAQRPLQVRHQVAVLQHRCAGASRRPLGRPLDQLRGRFRACANQLCFLADTVGLVVLFGVMLFGSLLPRNRTETGSSHKGILLALLAYALLRSTFFFFFNSKECMLFSSSATLAHMLLLGMPFTASTFPAKGALLLLLAILLFLTNGAFIIG